MSTTISLRISHSVIDDMVRQSLALVKTAGLPLSEREAKQITHHVNISLMGVDLQMPPILSCSTFCEWKM